LSIVYLAYTFIACAYINGQSIKNTDKEGSLVYIQANEFGRIMLAIIALRALIYSLWRAMQTFGIQKKKKKEDGTNAKLLQQNQFIQWFNLCFPCGIHNKNVVFYFPVIQNNKAKAWCKSFG